LLELIDVGLTTTERKLQSEVWPESSPSIDRGSDDAVGNSPGVRRELAEDIGSLLGWRKGVRWKKTETRRKIVKGSRKAYQELGRS
ncbi:hypothetical protein BHE74_00046096, partial [Ensete ventricosum]